MEAYKQLVQSKTVRAKHVEEPQKGRICLCCSPTVMLLLAWSSSTATSGIACSAIPAANSVMPSINLWLMLQV